MGQKKSLNQKRLTRKQVQEIIETEGKLHEEFTTFFEETYSTGYKNQPLVYELPGDRLLDFSYSSLDIISERAESYGVDRVQVDFYDNLVAYVGEVMRRRVKGQWAIESLPHFPGMYVVAAPLDPSDFSNLDWNSFQPEQSDIDRDYPIVRANKNGKSGILMPINVVWKEIDGLEPVNLRQETANEMRRFSLECR